MYSSFDITKESILYMGIPIIFMGMFGSFLIKKGMSFEGNTKRKTYVKKGKKK